MTHSRPETLPIPQIIEAEWTSPVYMPHAASCPISRNGEPGSSRLLTLSRAAAAWRLRCFSRASASPPSETSATFCLRSSTMARIRSELLLNSADRGLTSLLSVLTRTQNQGQTTFSGGLPFWEKRGLSLFSRVLLQGSTDHEALDRKVGDIAVPAVDLDRVGADALGRLGSEELGHRRFLDAGFTCIAQACGMEVELARGLDSGRHVGEPEVDRLVLDQRLAHAAALARIGERRGKRRSRHPGRLSRHIYAPGFEIRERDAIAGAFLGQ